MIVNEATVLEPSGEDDLQKDDLAQDVEAVEEETVEVDGEVYSAEDIKRLKQRGKDFQRDYTEKTEKLARERDKLKEEVEEVSKEKERNIRAQKAIHADIDFCKTHPREEWDTYTFEIDQVLGKLPTSEKRSIEEIPGIKELLKELDNLKEEVGSLKQERAGETFDNLLEKTKNLIAKDYPFASYEDVKNEIFVFYGVNKNKLPSLDWVKKKTAEKHDRVSKLAGKIPTGGKGDLSGLPSGEGAGIPAEKIKEVQKGKELNVTIAAEEGAKFFKNQQIKRGV